MDPCGKCSFFLNSLGGVIKTISITVALLSALTFAQCAKEAVPALTIQPLFENGADGYECFRIPATVRAPDGTILAFAEGRVHGCDDFGNVDIVLKTSADNGASWSVLGVVTDNDSMQVGNPGPVVDLLDPAYPNGRIFLFYNSGIASEHETRNGNGLREVWFKTSSNNGLSWSKPENITTSVHRPRQPDTNPQYNFDEDWRSYAVTPGHGIQLTHEPFRGRLFVPANHSSGDALDRFDEYRAHAFYSDDHGASWKLSESVEVPSSNESIAVELSDGRVMQNIREQSGRERKRLVAVSSDGGVTWDSTYFDAGLPGPVCQASILAVSGVDATMLNPADATIPVILFSNPATTDRRERMTVRASFDSGTSWSASRMIDAGPSAYSDLVLQPDARIGLLYEKGNDGGIHYARMDFAWLLAGSGE